MSVQEFLNYIRVPVKRWWLFLIVCGATIGGVLFSFRAMPPQFAATVQFLVNAPPSTDVTLYPGFDLPSQNQQIAATEAAFMEILQSPTVIQKTADALQITTPVETLREGITVVKPRDSEFVRVTVSASSAQGAADLANTLIAVAKEHYGQILAEPTASSREFISAQVESALQELEAAKQAWADFKKEHQVTDLDAEITSQRTIVWNLILDKGNAQVNGETDRASAYDQLIAEHQAELERLTALNDQYQSLRDEIKSAEAYYAFLVDKETEAKLKENEILRTGFIQLLEPARLPRNPVSPFDAKTFALAVVLSLVVSVIIAFVLEYRESRRAPKPHQEALAQS